MRAKCLMLTAVLIISCNCLGFQDNPPLHRGSNVEQFRWQELSEQVTADLLDKQNHLSDNDQLLLHARLCSAYWALDQTRAMQWCQRSITLVSRAALNESKQALQNRLALTRLLLRILGTLDSDFRVQLQTLLDRAGQSNSAAVALSQAAADSGDAVGSAKLISDSLSEGINPSTIISLIKLYPANPKSADDLFGKMITALADSRNSRILLELTPFIFPAAQKTSNTVPNAWQSKTLQLLGEQLQDSLQSDSSSFCDHHSEFELSRLMPRFSSVMTATVGDVLRRCKPPSPPSRPSITGNRTLNSVDEWMTAARETNDPTISAQLKFNAAIRSDRNDKDPERAIAILDGFTEEEKKILPGLWQLRKELAIKAAVAAFDRKDEKKGLAILDSSPSDMALSTDVETADQLSQRHSSELPVVMEHARQLVQAGESQDPSAYTKFISLYSQQTSDNKLSVVTEAVNALNDWKSKDIATFKPGEMFYPPLWQNLEPLRLSPEAAEIDPDSMVALAISLSNDELRTSFELYLLGEYLHRPKHTKQEAKKD